MPKQPQRALALPFSGELQGKKAHAVARLVENSGEDASKRILEFFTARIRNPHTRRAYVRAVGEFLAFCAERGKLSLRDIDPVTVAAYVEAHPASAPTRKVHLAAVRKLFDFLVTGQIIPVNPALSVEGPRHTVTEGTTPAFENEQVRQLLASLDTSTVVGLRDRAIIATLTYTAARVGALSKLRLKDFRPEGSQQILLFQEKRSKVRKIPVRHDLELLLLGYIQAAAIGEDHKNSPLFRPARRKTGRLKPLEDSYDPPPPPSRRRDSMKPKDMLRMLKRRLKDAGLPGNFTCHSFRATTITDLLKQGIPLEDVQYLAGHSDARTTKLYSRTRQEVTRNIVERISI